MVILVLYNHDVNRSVKTGHAWMLNIYMTAVWFFKCLSSCLNEDQVLAYEKKVYVSLKDSKETWLYNPISGKVGLR